MPTPLGFPDPPDSTLLALVYNWMRQLAVAIDTWLRGNSWAVVGSKHANITAGTFQMQSKRTAGNVTLSGRFATSANIPANTALFNVPAGNRPSRDISFVVAVPSAVNTVVVLTVKSTGDVTAEIALGAGSVLAGSTTFPAAS